MARGTNSLDDCWGSEGTPTDDAIVESIDFGWARFTGRRIALAARPRPHARGLDSTAPRPSAEMDVLTPARSQWKWPEHGKSQCQWWWEPAQHKGRAGGWLSMCQWARVPPKSTADMTSLGCESPATAWRGRVWHWLHVRRAMRGRDAGRGVMSLRPLQPAHMR
jgi:hypothetical protein